MKIGICADLRKATLAAAAGFDYIEGSLASVTLASDGEYAEMADAVALSGIAAEAFNVMLPGTFRLTGPEADLAPIRVYLEQGYSRAAALGAKIQVFGSGGARSVPDGWPMERALAQLTEFLKFAVPIAAEYGIAIAVEPLNPGECNIINTVSEAAALASRAGMAGCGALADWYHMTVQNEGTAGIVAAGKGLLHCHIANPEGRRFPMPGDGADFTRLFSALRQIGYTGRVSIEGAGADEEFTDACRRMRECL